MESGYLGVPASKNIRARTPPPLKILETTGAGSAYAALRSSARPGREHKRRANNASLLERIQRRPRLVLACIALALLAWLAWHLSADFIILMRFKLRDRAYEEGWIKGCGLRKRPLIFVRSSSEVAVVWESNCDREFELNWGLEQVQSEGGWWNGREVKIDKWERAKVKRVRIRDATNTHYAYQSILKALVPDLNYAYAISLPSVVETSQTIKAARSSSKPLASHSFPWHGPAATSTSSTLHFAALADNQYNVRTFHRILLALLSYSRALSPSLSKPDLILHAGDQVQNPHNLAQWQTDFWEALTSLLPVPLGQTTPILLARGNHDWDASGENAYTGGSPPRVEWLARKGRKARDKHVGTYMSYSPHQRCRILVLDSNLDKLEQKEQEEWLEWELGRKEWTRASLRIVMVHVPPFLEFWDKKAWTDGRESQWSIFVRLRLTPLLTQHGASMVLSGHQHAYSRGFLPHSLHRAYTSSSNSSTLPPFAVATVSERGWEKSSHTPNTIAEDGTIYVISGGAGGTLDEDRVEQWGFYERSIRRRYHFGWLGLGFASGPGGVGQVEMPERAKRVYAMQGREDCSTGSSLTDVLEWRAVGVDGRTMDSFRIEAQGCSR